MFHTRSDIRFFLSRLARQVRCGRLEVHAWCILTTHFHLLVRSRIGELAQAMRAVQLDHVRRFNRRHARDGSLGRDRFFSKRVDSTRYRRTLVRYIDHNAVQAGLAKTPGEYAWCSARQYREPAGPIWLERAWVEAQLRGSGGRARTYEEVFGGAWTRGERELVEARTTCKGVEDALDDLVGAAPEAVLGWLRTRALKADGTRVDMPVCSADSVSRAIDAVQASDRDWMVSAGRRVRAGWDVLRAGTMRDAAGCSIPEVAERTRSSEGLVRRTLRLHRDVIHTDPTYARRASELLAALLP